MRDARGQAETPGGSVRPSELDPAATGASDVLAGWDVDGAVPARLERPPFPLDTVVVGGAALVGALVGAAGGRGHRARRGLLGALVGVGAAGVLRRVWRSP
jgi:hypothetical protein